MGISMPKRYLAYAALFLFFALLLLGPDLLRAPGTRSTAIAGPTGERVPDFTLAAVGGEPVSLRTFLGKRPVFLVFWASWCPECRAAIPKINALRKGPLGATAQILAIDFRESRAKVEATVRSHGIRYPVLLDETGQVTQAYGVLGVPTYVLIDGRGRVIYRENVLPGAEIARTLAP
jgi:peroxiredoxin